MKINYFLVQEKQTRNSSLLYILAAGTFMIFFQAYMVAPLIPFLAETLATSERTIGLTISAYLIPYGIGSLLYGILSDYIGRRRIIMFSILAFALLTILTATVQSALQLLIVRFLTGLTVSGFIPLVLILIGDLFPYNVRGKAIGFIFAAMAGGTAFGSTVGALLSSFLSWRGLFILVGITGLLLWIKLLNYQEFLNSKTVELTSGKLHNALDRYRKLLRKSRSQVTYGYVLLNGIFHSGVFTWLGFYLSQRYNLNSAEVGLALFGYGIPGFLFSPIIGKVADRWGRNWLIPVGIGIAGISAAMLMSNITLAVAIIVVTTLSLGYDMSQPLLAGIVTDLVPKQDRGKAMGLNVFTLFLGAGLGSFFFGELIEFSLNKALLIFSTIQISASLMAIYLFRRETVISLQ